MTFRIIPRSEWGARFPAGIRPSPLPAQYVYIHHSVTAAVDGPGTIRALEEIGQTRFGAGISYSFVITPNGDVYEGHGVDREGAHTKGFNQSARAICCVGNYDIDQPPAAMLDSIVALVRHGAEQGWWPLTITGGHRDAPGASTACPGRKLHEQLPALRERLKEDTMPIPPWAAKGVYWARATRLIRDDGDINTPITTAQLVTILLRFAKLFAPSTQKRLKVDGIKDP